MFYNQNGLIKAMPYYNLIETTAGVIKQGAQDSLENEILVGFSPKTYWSTDSEGNIIQGWNSNSIDKAVDVDMTDKDTEGKYKNNLQQYINAYKETLEEIGIEGIIVRACKKQELDSELSSNLNNEQKKSIRNPSKTGHFDLGSGDYDHYQYIWRVTNQGDCYNYNNWYNQNGVRPIIIIEY